MTEDPMVELTVTDTRVTLLLIVPLGAVLVAVELGGGEGETSSSPSGPVMTALDIPLGFPPTSKVLPSGLMPVHGEDSKEWICGSPSFWKGAGSFRL